MTYRENRNGLSRAVAEQLLLQPALYDLECGLSTLKKSDVAFRCKLLGRYAHAFHRLSGCRAVYLSYRAELMPLGLQELSDLYIHMASDELSLGLDNECIGTMSEFVDLFEERTAANKEEVLSTGTRESLWKLTLALCAKHRTTKPKSAVISRWFGKLLQNSPAADAARVKFSNTSDWAVSALLEGATAVGRYGDRRSNLVALQNLGVIMREYVHASKTPEGGRFATNMIDVVKRRFKAEPLMQSQLYGDLALFEQVGERKVQGRASASRAAILLSKPAR